MSIRISTTSKLDGIRSWSLEALTTCPGSRTAGGDLVPACQGCYATTGHYIIGAVKQARQHNLSDWKRDTWFDDMLAELDRIRISSTREEPIDNAQAELEAAERLKVRSEISTMVNERPDEVAAMLRGWLTENKA